MDYYAGDLHIEGNDYYVKEKKAFRVYGEMCFDDVKDSFTFAYNMSYGGKGEHRDSRSGGSSHRKKGQIFINTFQGKMAEFAIYRYFWEHQIHADKPDTQEYELGKWDAFDLDCQGKHFSIKSTKFYGNLLLLETKDWNINGEYIPNLSKGTPKYDYTVLVRYKPDAEALMREHRLLYLKDHEIPKNIEEILTNIILNEKWTYDFPGFIYHSELVQLIKEERIIPKDALLNGTTKMDAENYYFQTGNMHEMIEVYRRNVEEKVDDRRSLRLKRICPKCGNFLVQRKGKSWFWGCEGYFTERNCRYTESDKK